jgi:hypothetical protein
MDSNRGADPRTRVPALPVEVIGVEPGEGAFMDYLRVKWLASDPIPEKGCAAIRTVLMLLGRN